MSGLSIVSAASTESLGALLGGAAEGSGRARTPEKSPSSFGAALALAGRMLDTGGEIAAPAPVDLAAVTDTAVLETCAFVRLPVEAVDEAQTSPDVESSTADTGLAVPSADLAVPPAEPTEATPNEVSLDVAVPATPDVAISVLPVLDPLTTADGSTPQIPDAEATPVPVTLATAPLANAPLTTSPTAAPEAPVIRPEAPVPPSAPSASDADALPVALAASASVPAATTAPKDSTARQEQPAAPLAPQASSTTATTPAVTVPPTSTTITGAPDASAAVPRAVAGQIAPVVVSIVQRPVGSHQLTMTVNPDTLGPVTVRAHISAGGDVRVEVLGVTDAGREALRGIVTDLRRDLAAVMPHASLSLGSNTAADAGASDRGAQPGAGGTQGEQPPGERGRTPADARFVAEGTGHGIQRILPITTPAVSGEGLDIFA